MGGYHDSPSKTFLSHSAEEFRRGTLYCFTTFGYRQILCFRGPSHDFLSKKFFSHSVESFRT